MKYKIILNYPKIWVTRFVEAENFTEAVEKLKLTISELGYITSVEETQ